jgi:predicted PurR-regulated permease PerM
MTTLLAIAATAALAYATSVVVTFLQRKGLSHED